MGIATPAINMTTIARIGGGFTTKPIAAPFIALGSTSGSSQAINITVGSGVANWTAQYKQSSASTWTTHGTVLVSATGYTFNGLGASTAYNFRLIDLASDIESNIVNATTNSNSTIYVQDDFATGYNWGTLPVTDMNVMKTKLEAGPWDVLDLEYDPHMSMEQWPGDPSKVGFVIQYLRNEEAGVLRKNFPNGVTHVFVKWRERRVGNPNFDFGPSKDYRFPSFVNNSGLTPDFLDIYGGIGRGGATSGVDPSQNFGINMQGVLIQSYPGDENVVQYGDFVMASNTDYDVELEVKLNTPGQSNAETRGWINGVEIFSRTGFKWYRDGIGQVYIQGFQFGMVASNNNQPFASNPNKIFRNNVVISSERFI